MANLKVAGGNKEATTYTKKGKFFDYTLLIVILVLLAFGLVMVYSTSSYSALDATGDSAYYFKKQLFATGLGLFCMFIVMAIDYHIWYKCSKFIYVTAIISIFLVLTPLGKSFNGARRWIGVGSLTVQPAEIVKLALIISLAAFITLSGKNMQKLKNNIAYIIMTGIAAGLIFFITNNLSTAIIIVGIAYVMLLVANPKPAWIIGATAVGVVAVVVFLVVFFQNTDTASGFRFKRLLAWRNPEAFASDEGYQTLQALYAIGSGGFFGKGLGNSIQKLGFIPEAQNDMIFSVVCEELGLFGGICLMVLFIIMIWRFMVIANNAPDLYGSMLVVGVLAHIAIQVILNIAVVTNTIPNTGITLPFISYGGTSVMFLLIEMAIVLNVSSKIRVPVPVGQE